MATKYPKSAQTGEQGVLWVRTIAAQGGGVFRPFESSDLGVDGAIELLTDQKEPSGDLVLTQVKAGSSYVRNGRFYVDADRDHFETWSRYALPMVGIVYDPARREARWVDISDYLRQRPEVLANGPYTIEAPAHQVFSVAQFPQFVSRFRRSAMPATRVDTTPNLLIRAWQPADVNPTRVLLVPIAPDYPNFDAWLTKKFFGPEANKASKKVVAVGNAIAAFSMWQPKDERNIKLQTFMVGPLYRGTAIGQHLLYHELRTWATDPHLNKLERVYVTVSSSKPDLIAYFRTFGFRVEGCAANRYPRSSLAAELILTKHLVREIVRTPTDLQTLADKLARQLWGVVPPAAARFGVPAADFAIPALLPEVKMALDTSESTVAPRIRLVDASGHELLRHDDESLMREFHPLRLHLKNKRYLLVPIYPEWVEAMLSTSGPHTPLKLRVDHVYYCYPKVAKLAKGDFVLFYETKTRKGRGAAIAGAVVQDVQIRAPTVLHSRYSDLGIYELADIERHRNRQGNAMAIKFALFEPFSRPGLTCLYPQTPRTQNNSSGPHTRHP